jgi:hypothetical protein
MTDRRDDASIALGLIRVVLSEAVNARERLALKGGLTETRRVPGGMDDEGYFGPYMEGFRDPDADEIDALLKEFIDKADKFAQRGADRRRRS